MVVGQQETIPKPVKFVLGGTAGVCAVMFTQPLDLVKNRMQMSGVGGAVRTHKSSLHAIVNVARREGPMALYTGLSAGALRQATYTSGRLGIYTTLFEHVSKGNKNPTFLMKATMGMTAGAVASFFCTPTEVALVRMTSDGRLPLAERRGYKNALDAIFRILKEEGVLALWRGCTPTVLRATVVNAAQLGTYSQAKEFLVKSGYFKDNILCHFGAAMISGLATTTCSMPVDVAKTRIQNMKIINGVPEYRNMLEVWFKIIRHEGIFALWKGFTPSYMRLGPHTVLTLMFLEQLNRCYFTYVLGVEKHGGGL